MEEDVWKVLQMRARELKCTVSELVREAVREKYIENGSRRREALLSAIGIWKDRTDLPKTATYVRRLRKSSRLKRLWK